MNTQMGSALPSEKLDRNNLASWEYKMHQYLVRQGYWSYIQPIIMAPEYATWEPATSRVMYCLATCVHDHMLNYIREANMPKEAWKNLRKIFAVNTSARRLQLHQELNKICWDTSSTSAGSAEEAEDRVGVDRSVRPSTESVGTDRIGRFCAENRWRDDAKEDIPLRIYFGVSLGAL